MIYKKTIYFYFVKANIAIPIDKPPTKRDISKTADNYDCKEMAINEKIIVDDDGIWAKESGNPFTFIKLLVTKEFLDANCPNFFIKES